MEHQRGKDPTPQGRTPDVVQRSEHTSHDTGAEEAYMSSVPGPDVQKDGAWFFGFKKEGTKKPEEKA